MRVRRGEGNGYDGKVIKDKRWIEINRGKRLKLPKP